MHNLVHMKTMSFSVSNIIQPSNASLTRKIQFVDAYLKNSQRTQHTNNKHTRVESRQKNADCIGECSFYVDQGPNKPLFMWDNQSAIVPRVFFVSVHWRSVQMQLLDLFVSCSVAGRENFASSSRSTSVREQQEEVKELFGRRCNA